MSEPRWKWLARLATMVDSFSKEQFSVIQSEGFQASEDEQVAMGEIEPNHLLPLFQGWYERGRASKRLRITAADTLPREAISYLGMENAYAAQGCIEIVPVNTHLWENEYLLNDAVMGPIASSFAANADALVSLAQDDIGNHSARWTVKRCVLEPDESYEALACIYQHAARLVLRHCTTVNVHSRNIKNYCPVVMIKKVARSPGALVSVPDLALSIVDPGGVVVSALMTQSAYEWCDLYAEMKNDVCKLPEARGQVLDRAEKRRKAAGALQRVVLGTTSTGAEVELMVVLTDATTRNRLVRTNVLPLDQGQRVPLGVETVSCGTVHRYSAALPEILFQCYSLMHLSECFEMKAGAGAPKLESSSPAPPSKYVVRSGDWNQVLELKVVHTYVNYLFRGGCYLVEGGDRKSMVLKRGSTTRVQRMATALGVEPELFVQVENEVRVRDSLRGFSGKLRIPEILWSGWGVEPFEWRECPVILMSHVGESLHDRILPVADAAEMGSSLLATLEQLHKRGIIHRDICPRNVAYREEAIGLDRFSLLDFGVAGFRVERSPVKDLEFGCMNALCGEPVDASGDLESLLYTMVKVAGMELPWSAAAHENDEGAVLAIRRELLQLGSIAHYTHPLFLELEERVFGRQRNGVQVQEIGTASPPLRVH